jgi:protoporphyrinogen oxidase
MFLSTKRSNWQSLDQQYARQWITKWTGKKTYDLLWKRLFELKLFEYTDHISAAWIWTRIKRVGTSRRSIFQEQLGYIQGGSATFIDRIVKEIVDMGGVIKLGNAVSEVTIKDNKVKGIITDGGEYLFDCVVSTVPTPLIEKLIPALPGETKEKYNSIKNIGVVCVVAKLSKPATPHFWVNINDKEIDIPGIVEYSNLRSLSKSVVYVPYYMPQSHPKFHLPDEYFKQEVTKHLKKLNKHLADSDIEAIRVHRLKHAQPICTPGFLNSIPCAITPIDGLQIADTAYYYPEDRGLSESVRYGKLLASRIS